MFEDFLKEYIQDLVECSSEKYDLRDDIINDIAATINADEHVWEVIDIAIYDELNKYAIESGEEDE